MRIKVMKTLVSCFDETCPKNCIPPSAARVLGETVLNKSQWGGEVTAMVRRDRLLAAIDQVQDLRKIPLKLLFLRVAPVASPKGRRCA